MCTLNYFSTPFPYFLSFIEGAWVSQFLLGKVGVRERNRLPLKMGINTSQKCKYYYHWVVV